MTVDERLCTIHKELDHLGDRIKSLQNRLKRGESFHSRTSPKRLKAKRREHELNGTELRIVCFYVNGLNDVRVWEHHVWTFGTDPHFPFSDAP